MDHPRVETNGRIGPVNAALTPRYAGLGTFGLGGGGKGGGGATLSEAGQRLVDAYRSLEAEHARQVTRLNDKLTRLLG